MSDHVSPPRGSPSLPRLRPQQPDDEAFLFKLFSTNAAEILGAAGLPQAAVDQLVALQHRAQTLAYRSAFPHARFQVAELDGERVGRLVEADAGNTVHIVDIALLPEHQGRGLGRSLVSALMQDQAPLGRGVSAQTAVGNVRSLRMFEALGFTLAHPPHSSHVEFLWRPAPYKGHAEGCASGR